MAASAPAPMLRLNTYRSLVTTFTDFLVVAIHTILYERGIYPATTFISTRRYNFPVRQNRHPKVCQWVLDAVAAVEAELLKGSVARVAVVIYSAEAAVLERFMFDVSSFPQVPQSEILAEFEEADETSQEVNVSLVDVEEQLRATVRKLAFCGSQLGVLPNGCTYTVAMELKDSAPPPIGHPQPWIPSVPSLQTGTDSGRSDLGGVKSAPVRSVEAGRFVFDSWVEEGKAKHQEPVAK